MRFIEMAIQRHTDTKLRLDRADSSQESARPKPKEEAKPKATQHDAFVVPEQVPAATLPMRSAAHMPVDGEPEALPNEGDIVELYGPDIFNLPAV